MKSSENLVRILIVAVLVLAVAIYLAQRNTYHVLSGLEGPTDASRIADDIPTAWTQYDRGTPSRLAILLTDEDSTWLGLAHGLKTIGVPFTITTDVSRALEHQVVLAYPMIAGSVLDADEFDQLREHVTTGGTLIASQVLGGGLQDIFGFESVSETRDHYQLSFSSEAPSTRWLDDPRERTVLLGAPDDPASWIGTQVYHGAQTPLAHFQDGAPAVVTHEDASGGQAYALGFDLGFFIQRAYNDRNSEAYRDYANAYEPSVDVWLRWLRHLYQYHEPQAVTVDTVPEGQALSVIVSLDVDFAHSMDNMLAYRDLLDQLGVPGTYFIQTKYFRDYYDQGFFNDATPDVLDSLHESGMEIASHSVSHTDMYASVPLGSGEERFPDYQPRVRGVADTIGASVLGEMRVSRFLLEALSDAEVVSFRPGYLATPDALPQALEASGYRYSSSVTAGNVTPHLPYRATYDRRYQTQTGIYEFPIAIEDEIPPRMDLRVDAALALADQLKGYGGTFVILLHPDVLDYKYAFLEQIIPALKPDAWFGTLAQFGDWWRARDQLEVDVIEVEGQRQLQLYAPIPVQGVTLRLPSHWQLGSGAPDDMRLESSVLHLPEVTGELRIPVEPY